MTVLDWLLDSDPALRWQVLRDLSDASPEVVAAERARVATEGWGAWLLALRGDDGQWAGGACFPADFRGDFSQDQPWTSTLPTLTLLRDFGIDPDAHPVRETVALVRENSRWEHAGQPFFAGEGEPCINGRTVAIGAYFAVDVDSIVGRLLGDQLADGGWNCETENGSVRASFATTICVLEGLLQHERVTGGSARAVAARRRGQQYLLDRRLFRRLSTGEVVDPDWLRFSFTTWWHYDVLRALDYFRAQSPRLIRDSPRRSLCCARSSSPTAPGYWSTPIAARCTSRWRTATGTQSLEHAARTSGAELVRRQTSLSSPRRPRRQVGLRCGCGISPPPPASAPTPPRPAPRVVEPVRDDRGGITSNASRRRNHVIRSANPKLSVVDVLCGAGADDLYISMLQSSPGLGSSHCRRRIVAESALGLSDLIPWPWAVGPA